MATKKSAKKNEKRAPHVGPGLADMIVAFEAAVAAFGKNAIFLALSQVEQAVRPIDAEAAGALTAVWTAMRRKDLPRWDIESANPLNVPPEELPAWRDRQRERRREDEEHDEKIVRAIASLSRLVKPPKAAKQLGDKLVGIVKETSPLATENLRVNWFVHSLWGWMGYLESLAPLEGRDDMMEIVRRRLRNPVREDYSSGVNAEATVRSILKDLGVKKDGRKAIVPGERTDR